MTKWNAVALRPISLSHSCSFVWDFLSEVYIIYRWYNQWTFRIDISRRWCEMIFIIINWTDKQTVRKLSVTQVCFSSDSCRRGDECKTHWVSDWSELETWHARPSNTARPTYLTFYTQNQRFIQLAGEKYHRVIFLNTPNTSNFRKIYFTYLKS